MSAIEPATILQQSGDAVTREISGQLIILTPAEGNVHELDELGCFIWKLCAAPISVDAMTAEIVAEYEVDAAVAQKDLIPFLTKLIDFGALTKQ